MNDFENSLRDLSNKATIIKDNILNEEATKTSLILPLFRILGYDIENPQLMIPEYAVEGDRVDYSIMCNDSPLFFIEAKNIKESLEKHTEQAKKYFDNSEIKIICLTNGLDYNFYSDLNKDNEMDSEPFLSLNIENLTDFEMNYLTKLSSSNFNLENCTDIAYQIKATEFIRHQLEDPSEEFIRFVANNVSCKKKTKKFLSRIKEFICYSIQDVLKFFSNGSITIVPHTSGSKRPNSNIVTTQEEMDGYKIIISILSEMYSIDNVNYKDTQSYFAVITDNKPKQWITRLCLGTKKKSIMIPNDENKYDRFYINDIQDLYNYKEQLIKSANKYLAIKTTISESEEQILLNKPENIEESKNVMEPEIIEVPKKKKGFLDWLTH